MLEVVADLNFGADWTNRFWSQEKGNLSFKLGVSECQSVNKSGRASKVGGENRFVPKYGRGIGLSRAQKANWLAALAQHVTSFVTIVDFGANGSDGFWNIAIVAIEIRLFEKRDSKRSSQKVSREAWHEDNPAGSLTRRQFVWIIPKNWRWICLRRTQDTDVTANFAPNHFNVVPSVLLWTHGSDRFCTKQSESTLITLSLWRREARRDQKRKEAEFRVKPETYRKTGVGKACAGQRIFMLSPMAPRMTWMFSPVLIFGATDPTGSLEKNIV